MIALALAALLSFQDPAGDTFGDGSLVAPTAAVFRTLGSFDLLGAEVLDTPELTLALTFAALPNPLDLPNGFSLPIIELYVGDETAGSPDLLPGSGMSLPGGSSWHYAFRLTGDRVQAFVAEAGPSEGNAVDGGAVGSGKRVELSATDGLEVTVDDNVVTLKTPLPRPESLTLYGSVGGYSPFSASGWQGLSAVPAPWTFSSAEQTVPVVDVLAEDENAQAQAVATRTLPALRRAAPPAPPRENRWLLLVAGGVVVALVGLAGRFTVPKTDFHTGLPADHEAARAPVPASAQTDEAAEPAKAPPSGTAPPATAVAEDEPFEDTATGEPGPEAVVPQVFVPEGAELGSAEVESAEVESAEIKSAEVESAEVESAEPEGLETQSVTTEDAEVVDIQTEAGEARDMQTAGATSQVAASRPATGLKPEPIKLDFEILEPPKKQPSQASGAKGSPKAAFPLDDEAPPSSEANRPERFTHKPVPGPPDTRSPGTEPAKATSTGQLEPTRRGWNRANWFTADDDTELWPQTDDPEQSQT